MGRALKRREVKIRKMRRCHACGRWHQPGEYMLYYVGIVDDLGFRYGYFCLGECP
jgi:hypothetical protein